METKRKTKVVKALLGLGVAALLFGATACTPKLTQDQANKMVVDAVTPLQDQITSLQTELATLKEKADTQEQAIQEKEAKLAELQDQLARDEAIIEDYKRAEAELAGAAAEAASAKIFDNLDLAQNLVFNLKDNNFQKLLDTSIMFNDESYDIEEVVYSTGDLQLEVSALNDKDFGANPYLATESKGAIVYEYRFTDPIPYADVTDTEELKVSVLGKDMVITDVTPTSIDYRIATEYSFVEGETKVIDGKEITLLVVSNDKVAVDVDGTVKILPAYDSETVSGIDVEATEVMPNDDGAGFATLLVGDNVADSIDNGDDFMGDERYKFEIMTSGDDLLGFRVSYNVVSNDLDDDYPVIGVGDSIDFPNNYISIEFRETTPVDITEYNIAFDVNDDLPFNKEAIVITGDAKNSILIGTEEVDEVYITSHGALFYYDDNNDIVRGYGDLVLQNDETNVVVTLNGGVLSLDDGEGVTNITVDIAGQKFGALAEEAETAEVSYEGTNVGDRDYDVLLPYGTVIKNTRDGGDRDELVLEVPSEKVEATVWVK